MPSACCSLPFAMVEARPQSRLMVLMFTDVVGSVELKQRHGDAAVAKMISRHDEIFRYTVAAFPFAEILKDVGDGFLARFSSASDAVHAALHFQNALHNENFNGERLKARIGLHLGEVAELEPEGLSGSAKLSGFAVDITARVMGLALPGQILMTRAAFDNARQYVREFPQPVTVEATASKQTPPARKWMAHGRYLFKGAEEPLEVFEVGEVGIAPLRVPPDTDKARRAVAADQEETLGWRPAVGLDVPDRKNWILDHKLGEGGFGEVWLAEHAKTHMRRVFKFCFDAERLRSFKRELTLFRLLQVALGDRNDIAKLHEVKLDAPPFYLESEFTEDGSLVEWAATKGGIDKVPLATRLDLVARTAIAVAAAHSVGVLHKDIKPSNILIYRAPDGQPMPRLTDFGIGELTDRAKLAGRNIMVTGMTESLITGNESSRTGTRIYAPPEALVGKPFTIQGDVYALGVLLYQMVVGDLEKPLAQGWERDIADPLLREDIARCVEGDEQKRLASATELAHRLQNLAARRRARQRRRIARASVITSGVLVIALSIATVVIVREQRLRVQKEREADKATAITEFLQNMLSSVDPRLLAQGAGADVKVADLLRQASHDLDTRFPDKPEIEAALRWTIGNAYKALGLYQDSEPLLRSALEIRRRVLGEPNEEVAQALQDLSAALYWDARLSEAEELARQSLRMREAMYGPEDLLVASSLNYLAAVLDKQERSAEAEPLYRRALELRRKLAKGKDREYIARSLNNLAKCLQHQKKYKEAEQLYYDALNLQSELRGSENIDVANAQTNIAIFLLQTGGPEKHEEAQHLLLQASQLKRRFYPNGHQSLATTLYALADVMLRQNKLDDARTYAQQALDMRRAALRSNHPEIAESLDQLASISSKAGDAAAAADLQRQAANVRQQQ
jgi:class 3 adenylate cyclase/serine/threonine protein kinase